MKKSKNIILDILIIIFAAAFIFFGYQWYTEYRGTQGPQYTKLKTVKDVNDTKKNREHIRDMVMRDATNGKFKKQGFVSIPEKGILLPIYDDAYSNAGLNVGSAYANKDIIPVMGEKNYGLAAHNFDDGKTGFSSLQDGRTNEPYLVNGKPQDKVSNLNGIKIYMMDENNIYQYTIYNQLLVKPEQFEVMNNDLLTQDNKPKLTIVSCLFPDTSWRIITEGKLDKKWSIEKAPFKIVNYFNLEKQNTNARVSWWNPGVEEGANGDAGGTKKVK